MDVVKETLVDCSSNTRYGPKAIHERLGGDFAATTTIERHLTKPCSTLNAPTGRNMTS
ncbi:hypothetical protein WN51_00612 [Melipona quadrifasciata]|uniref:Uncharacterized protein n=1 Tax=Melipona quadrifasciata TaxID=166423 RepID=A0A0N0BG48_9HYME|nr:hypothetical protein WN51_00612 [Melipona quadrifasciata]